MPFIIMQQPSIALGFIMQSCWSMTAAVLSEQVQVHFMPPDTSSNFIVQRGTIMPAGIEPIVIGPDICCMLLGIETVLIMPLMRSLVEVLVIGRPPVTGNC